MTPQKNLFFNHTFYTMKYDLIKYRDMGMNSYTWFWINENDHVVSPYFDNEEDAYEWVNITVLFKEQ